MVEVGSYETRTTVERPLVGGELCFIEEFRWRHWDSVSFHVGVKPVGCGTTDGSEEMIETSVYWSVGYGARIVDAFDGL
jgi:hypothetical protein